MKIFLESGAEKVPQDAYESARALLTDNIRTNDTGFDTWEYLKNNNPFQAFPVGNLPETMGEAPFFSDFPQDIFKNEPSVVPPVPKASSVPKPTSTIKTRSANKAYDRNEYLEDNYRLKNQLIFSSSSGISSRISTPALETLPSTHAHHTTQSALSGNHPKELSRSASMPSLNHQSNSMALEMNQAALNSWISSTAKDKRRYCLIHS